MSKATVHSAVVHGVQGVPITITAEVLNMLPSFQIVGLPLSSVKEARERVRSAIASSGTVHVALTLPADWASCRVAWACAPPGGIAIRVRPPGRGAIAGVTVGGAPWNDYNSTAHTVSVDSSQLTAVGMLSALQSVVVSFTK